ncbi:hypothetical protein GCM10007875_13130 [Limnobacter litoralis]|uniref:4a-hydroxytetrahydrobiopterin dehydratase n=2 Tax=Burkholderiaceae TaxID=119060 RepID=A0ABQ5YNP3_9BURK|nr:hypothetical protein GCM10007875_13130 [Limnobacter litoralis]
MKSMKTPRPPSDWEGEKCRHITAKDQWSLSEIQAQLALFDGWSVQTSAQEGKAISLWRSWQPGQFGAVKAMVDCTCQLADQEDHHPEVTFSYGAIEVHWSTHSAGGISDNDWICAAKLDRLFKGLNSVET